MFLPQQADYVQGAQVVLVDYPPALEGSATANGSGVATLTFDAVDQPFLWRIERMTTFLSIQSQPSGAMCLVYEGPSTRAVRLRDGSSSPSLDIADEQSPITVQPSSQLIIEWIGLTPGTVASASVQYQLWRRIIPGS